jgi:hypothetical protein
VEAPVLGLRDVEGTDSRLENVEPAQRMPPDEFSVQTAVIVPSSPVESKGNPCSRPGDVVNAPENQEEVFGED